jgi:hypothetical protein
MTEGPYFIALYTLAGKIPQDLILIIGTGLTNIGQEF